MTDWHLVLRIKRAVLSDLARSVDLPSWQEACGVLIGRWEPDGARSNPVLLYGMRDVIVASGSQRRSWPAPNAMQSSASWKSSRCITHTQVEFLTLAAMMIPDDVLKDRVGGGYAQWRGTRRGAASRLRPYDGRPAINEHRR